MLEALRAQEILAEKYDVAADVWSVTSYQQLRNDALVDRALEPAAPGRAAARALRHAPAASRRTVRSIAATDYMKSVPDMIARWMPRPFTPLGTDGFGRSDTREALRRHFEIDAEHIVVATLAALAAEGLVKPGIVASAMQTFGIDPEEAGAARELIAARSSRTLTLPPRCAQFPTQSACLPRGVHGEAVVLAPRTARVPPPREFRRDSAVSKRGPLIAVLLSRRMAERSMSADSA